MPPGPSMADKNSELPAARKVDPVGVGDLYLRIHGQGLFDERLRIALSKVG